MVESAKRRMDEPADVELRVAEVVSFAEGTRPLGTGHRLRPLLIVLVGTREVRAQKAASCLLDPAVGDKVLVALGEVSWILSVLESAASAGRITMHGDMVLEATGELRLQGDQSVSVVAPDRFRVDAGESALHFDSVSLLASKLVGTVLESRWIGERATTILSSLTQRLGYSHRVVEQLDQSRAKQIEYAAEGSLSLKADSASVCADKAVKIDAAQIIVG